MLTLPPLGTSDAPAHRMPGAEAPRPSQNATALNCESGRLFVVANPTKCGGAGACRSHSNYSTVHSHEFQLLVMVGAGLKPWKPFETTKM
jgi:hypothetical protein